jgi:hypothetical protein
MARSKLEILVSLLQYLALDRVLFYYYYYVNLFDSTLPALCQALLEALYIYEFI